MSRKKYQLPKQGIRRALCFDVGIVNFACALVVLEGEEDFTIDFLESTSIVEKSAAKKPKNANDIPSSLLTEYTINYLVSIQDKTLVRKPNIIVIEQQAEFGIKYRIIGNAIQAFYYTLYKSRGEEPPPIVFQNGSQKLRVVVKIPGSFLSNKWNMKQSSIMNFMESSSSSSSNGRDSTGSEKKLSKSQKYTRDKKYTEDMFALFLEYYRNCWKWISYYKSLKEKDHIADAAFHGIFFLVVSTYRLTKSCPKQIVLPIPKGVPTTITSPLPKVEQEEEEEEEDEEKEEEQEDQDSWDNIVGDIINSTQKKRPLKKIDLTEESSQEDEKRPVKKKRVFL